MNEKQSKLMRYLVKYTQKNEGVVVIKRMWPILTHKEKGKITKKARNMVATLHALREREEQQQAESILKSLQAVGVATNPGEA
jgi:23S rRNA maturation mini-RNase III